MQDDQPASCSGLVSSVAFPSLQIFAGALAKGSDDALSVVSVALNQRLILPVEALTRGTGRWRHGIHRDDDVAVSPAVLPNGAQTTGPPEGSAVLATHSLARIGVIELGLQVDSIRKHGRTPEHIQSVTSPCVLSACLPACLPACLSACLLSRCLAVSLSSYLTFVCRSICLYGLS
jgi:hypothetical protein